MLTQGQPLQDDAEALMRLAAAVDWLEIEVMEGRPPERLILSLYVSSPVRAPGHAIEMATRHRVELYLPLDYPNLPPLCRPLGPLFHPNATQDSICLGPFWQPGYRLVETATLLADLLAWRRIDLVHGVNLEAVAWAVEHPAAYPFDKTKP